MRGAIFLFSILIFSICILWLYKNTEGYEDMGDIINHKFNPLASFFNNASSKLLIVDQPTPDNVKQMYSMAMPVKAPFPSLSPEQDKLLSDIEFCKKYPTTLSATSNPFTDGPSTERFNQMCGMCMTEGRLLTGEKFPIKGSPGPVGTGVVVYEEDKQVSKGVDAIPSFNCAHCAPIFLSEPTPNVTPVAINSEQYVATLKYMEDNDLIYESGCSSSSENNTVQCHDPDKRIVESKLFYGSWNEGTCGQVTESNTDFIPVKTQVSDDLNCYGESSCTIQFPAAVKKSNEWEIEGRCDYVAPKHNPVTYTINKDCLPVILSGEFPRLDGTEISESQAKAIWGFDTKNNAGPFTFTKDYINPDKTKSFKAILRIALWHCTGKVFLNGKIVKFQIDNKETDRITGFQKTLVMLPTSTSRIKIETEKITDGYPTPCVVVTVSSEKTNTLLFSSDNTWVYVVKGYRPSFPDANDSSKCKFIPHEYANQYANDPQIIKCNGNQEALAYHWITQGLGNSKSPCGSRNSECQFNPDTYNCMNLDVLSAKVDPLNHYITYGFKEGRNLCPVRGETCKIPPPVPGAETVFLWGNCENGSGWQKVLSGEGLYQVNLHFPWDASYIVVGPGIKAIVQSSRGDVQEIDGPGEFNFCSRDGFNDNVKRIRLIKPGDTRYKDLGCWNDNPDRMLKGPYAGRGYNKETCGLFAKSNNQKFFSVQDGNECYTGNDDFSRYGEALGECPDTGGGWKAHVWANNSYSPPTNTPYHSYGCEGEGTGIKCPEGTVITDGWVYYGKWGTRCDGVARPVGGSVKHMKETFQYCLGKNICEFNVNNGTMGGDPYPNVRKEFEVTAMCADPSNRANAPPPASAPPQLRPVYCSIM